MNPLLEIDPSICHGKPIFRGTRVLVSTVLGALAGGDSIEDVLEDYPAVTKEHLKAAFDFASQLTDRQLSAYDAIA